jgi:acyl-[acyl-carrier-protein]-phospholipid O-acyltransferase/long-chain-fatty-acid--[acyl-carrier-protein] ligase
LPDDQISLCVEKLAAADIPNLWKPKKDQFFSIEKLPYLGTGKLDLRRVKELAAEWAG